MKIRVEYYVAFPGFPAYGRNWHLYISNPMQSFLYPFSTKPTRKQIRNAIKELKCLGKL